MTIQKYFIASVGYKLCTRQRNSIKSHPHRLHTIIIFVLHPQHTSGAENPGSSAAIQIFACSLHQARCSCNASLVGGNRSRDFLAFMKSLYWHILMSGSWAPSEHPYSQHRYFSTPFKLPSRPIVSNSRRSTYLFQQVFLLIPQNDEVVSQPVNEWNPSMLWITSVPSFEAISCTG